VPANRFGGALGAVMMVAWAGMASSSYFSGRLFDATLSYNLSFVVAGVAGTLNLMVLALIGLRQRNALRKSIDPGVDRLSNRNPRQRGLAWRSSVY
jgi:hypothetical protein